MESPASTPALGKAGITSRVPFTIQPYLIHTIEITYTSKYIIYNIIYYILYNIYHIIYIYYVYHISMCM